MASALRRLTKAIGSAVILIAIGLGGATSAAAQVTWTTEAYGDAELTNDDSGGGDLITVNTRPGGTYYRANLDPTHEYRIILTGRAVGGDDFILRTRVGSAPYRYRPAPNGQDVFRASASGEVELLLFAHYPTDSPSYRVRSLEVEDCGASCESNETLRSRILGDIPELPDLLQRDPYRAAVRLMRWTSPLTPWAGGGTTPISTAGLSAAEMYFDLFAEARAGVFCGGTADFLRRVLELFNLPAFQVNFGDRAVFDHAIVLVPTTRGTDGARDFLLLDPTFNAEFTLDGTSRPVTAGEILELWRAGQVSRIAVMAASLDERQVLEDPDRTGLLQPTTCGADPEASTGCSLDYFGRAWNPYFAAGGYAAGYPGVIQLLATGELFGTDTFGTDTFGTDPGFISMHSAFQNGAQVAPLPGFEPPPDEGSNDATTEHPPPQLPSTQRRFVRPRLASRLLRKRSRGRRLLVVLRCPGEAGEAKCSGTLDVLKGTRLVAHAHVRIASGHPTTIELRPRRSGRSIISRLTNAHFRVTWTPSGLQKAKKLGYVRLRNRPAR